MNDIFSQFHKFDPFTIGFTDVFKELESMSKAVAKAATYPPYNIKQINDNKFVIEMAVAGFGKSNLDIELKDDKLTITGNHDATENDYIYQGIANRAFTRAWAIGDQYEVKNAEMLNGVLKIALDRLVPEEKKPKKIDVK